MVIFKHIHSVNHLKKNYHAIKIFHYDKTKYCFYNKTEMQFQEKLTFTFEKRLCSVHSIIYYFKKCYCKKKKGEGGQDSQKIIIFAL